MRIYVPATPDGLDPGVVPAILAAGWEATVIPMLAPGDYARWFTEAYGRPATEPFAIVEHDVIVTPGTLRLFDECPEPWCVNPYNDRRLLGCTRFKPGFLPALPPLWANWDQLDQAIYRWLRWGGAEPHVHEERPEHRHHSR
jgi:hypothetical protein